MKKKYKEIFLTLCLAIAIFLPLQNTLATDNFNNGFEKTAQNAGFTEIDALKKPLDGYVSLVINIFLSIVGIIFLGLMIYGGFVWMNAKGNETETQKAMSIIRNAIIGMLVVFVAYTITTITYTLFDTSSEDAEIPEVVQ